MDSEIDARHQSIFAEHIELCNIGMIIDNNSSILVVVQYNNLAKIHNANANTV